MSEADPWTSVKEEVVVSMAQARELFGRWQELAAEIGPTSDLDEFEWTTKELKKSLKSIGWDLVDLDETVDVVEENPAKFNLTRDELQVRRAFTKKTKAECDKISETLEDGRITAKVSSAKRDALMSGGTGASSRYAKLQESARAENDNFIKGQEQQQQLVMREQDQQLSEVHQTVGVLKTMGVAISTELDDQAELLDDFDGEMDTTQQRLERALTKLDKTLEISKDKKQSCCIVLLFLLMIIMIIVYVS
eukprot:m.179610 g.179610  ORF g.179610 m.179610 type:complete len:250 (+) comp14804_c0_seq1:347-1096(+)